MIKFSKEKVLLLHRLIAEETGGSIGVRDEGLLEAALEKNDPSVIRYALHQVVPTFHEPEDLNQEQGQEVRIPEQPCVG